MAKLRIESHFDFLLRLADLLLRDLTTLATLETLDNGKSFADACYDVHASSATLKYYAGWCDKIHGNTIPADGTSLTFTRKEPVGMFGIWVTD